MAVGGDDTDIGGPREGFPATPASAVLGTSSDDPVARGRAFQTLVLAYWKPVYKTIRARWRRSSEEAKDLTQAFFARAFEKEIFSTYDPTRSRFRTFLRTCLRNFVANQDEALARLKRGGGVVRLALDTEEAELELARAAPSEGESLEDAFDRELARSLHAMGVSELRARLEGSGRALYYRVFELYDLAEDPAGRPTYAAIAAEIGRPATDVTNYLAFARRELRRILLDRLRELTASEEEFRSEALWLLGVDPAHVR